MVSSVSNNNNFCTSYTINNKDSLDKNQNSNFILDAIDIQCDKISIFDNPEHLRFYADSCLKEVSEDLSRKGIDTTDLRFCRVVETASIEDLNNFLKDFKSNNKFNDDILENNLQAVKKLFNKYINKEQMNKINPIFNLNIDKIKQKKNYTRDSNNILLEELNKTNLKLDVNDFLNKKALNLAYSTNSH